MNPRVTTIRIGLAAIITGCLVGGGIGLPTQQTEPRAADAAGMDCNGNGIPDDQDLAGGLSFDFNGNGIPDECDAFLTGDRLEPGTQHCPPAAPSGTCGGPYQGAATASPTTTYLATGEFYHSVVDLRIPGRGLDFVWSRKYRSRFGPNTVMGNSWDHSYNVYLEPDGPSLILHDGNGREDHYSYDGVRDSWHARQFFREIRLDPADGSYTLTFADTGQWRFHPLDGAPFQGRLTNIIDRNGNELTLVYGPDGRLEVLWDTLGRLITIGYNADGLIESVTDFAGRTVTYEYYGVGDPDGSFGDLKSVTTPAVIGTPTGNDFPDGKTTTYTYSTGFFDEMLNHNLLTITDPKGHTWLSNVYDDVEEPMDPNYDRLIRQSLGVAGADDIDIFYVPQMPMPHRGFAVMKAIVKDRAQNVEELFFDIQNRGVLQHEYTGRAPDPSAPTTDFHNRPVGKLRPADPDRYEARWEFDNHALPTWIEYPNENSVQNEYDSANPDPRAQGNLLLRRQLPGPLGGDQPEIVEFFEYEDGFGGCCGANFVIRHVDGRGHETVHDYDEFGNRTHTQHRLPEIVEDWHHNAFGQVIEHVLPDNGSGHRRRDTYTYYGSGPQMGYLQEEIVDADNFALTTTYEYDSVGNVIRIIDPRGNDRQFVVNPLNQVVRSISREVEPGGTRYERDTYYDANDNVVRIDVQNIDDQGVLQTNTHYTTVREYDLLDGMTRQCQEAGDYTGSIPGPPELPTCDGLTSPDFVTTEYEYDANRNETLVRYGEAVNGNQPTNVLRTLYDERDRVYLERRAEGDPDESTAQSDYDGNGNRVRMATGLEGLPRVTEYEYDGFNRVARVTDPMGNVTEYHYDGNANRVIELRHGELVDVEGDAGNVLLYEEIKSYDPMDRLIISDVAFFDTATQMPIGDGRAMTLQEWSPNSQLTRVTDDNGRQSALTYDTANRRHIATDAKNNQITLTYDENSNLVTMAETEKSDLGEPDEIYYSNYSYDGCDRRIRTDNNISMSTHAGYDSRGNKTLTIDASTYENRYTYDGLDRRLDYIRDMDGDGADGDGDDIVLTQVWDDSSRLIEEIDGRNYSTNYSYDPLGRRIETSYADGTFETNTYDAHDNITIMSDSNGNHVSNGYDLNNQVTHRDIIPGPGVAMDTTLEDYAYDGLSRLVSAVDNDAAVTLEYDSLSNVVREQVNGLTTTAQHDGVGNRLECTYPDGRQVTRLYDDLNRTGMIADGSGMLATYLYVGPDRVAQIAFGNGTQVDYTYDGILPNPSGDFGVKQIVQMQHTRISDGAVVDDRAFTWDPMHNKTRRADVRLDGPALAHDYTYDPAYRLRNTIVTTDSGDQTRNTACELDKAGNRTFMTGPICAGDYQLDDTMPHPADDQVNQYTTIPTGRRHYDENGNLVQIAAAGDCDDYPGGHVDLGDYALLAGCLSGPGGGAPDGCQCFDADGDDDVDLADFSAFQRNFSGDTPRGVTLVYDYRNQMVEWHDYEIGRRDNYSYDPLGRRIGRIVDSDGTPEETRFVYYGAQVVEEQNAAGETQATYVYGNDIDEVLTMHRGGLDYYYHTDDLFNVMALTNAAAEVVERYEYDDYGMPTIKADVRDPDRDELFDSDNDTSSAGVVQIIADSFVLTGEATLRTITFAGGYSYATGAPEQDDFTIFIYDGAAGLPGPVLNEMHMGNIERRLTGRVITSAEGDVPEYAYSAVVNPPITLTAGQPYYVSIVNNTTGHDTTWGWSSSGTGDGDLAWRHDDGPWGHYPANTSFELHTDASAVGNPYLFTGRRYDDETGLYYYRLRYLDPMTGRFTTRDPMGVWGDFGSMGNPRAYAGNNPATNTDPTGLWFRRWRPRVSFVWWRTSRIWPRLRGVPPWMIPGMPFWWGPPGPGLPPGVGGFALAPRGRFGPAPHAVTKANRWWWWQHVNRPAWRHAHPGGSRGSGGGGGGTVNPIRVPVPGTQRRGTGVIQGPSGPLRCGNIWRQVFRDNVTGNHSVDIWGTAGAVPVPRVGGVPQYTKVRVDIAWTRTIWISNVNTSGRFNRRNEPLRRYQTGFFIDVWYQDPITLRQIGPCRI